MGRLVVLLRSFLKLASVIRGSGHQRLDQHREAAPEAREHKGKTESTVWSHFSIESERHWERIFGPLTLSLPQCFVPNTGYLSAHIFLTSRSLGGKYCHDILTATRVVLF